MSKVYVKNCAIYQEFDDAGKILKEQAVDFYFCVSESEKKKRVIEVLLPDVYEGYINAVVNIDPVKLRKILDAGWKEFERRTIR